MKHYLLFIAAILLATACQNDAEFGNHNQTDNPFADPYGIVVNQPLSDVSFSYDLGGIFKTANECTDDGAATYALATRGDLCVQLLLVNTSNATQNITRQNFVLNIDNLQGQTPTTLYKSNGRAVRYISIAPGGSASVTLYYQNLFGNLSTGWPYQQPDANATYSIDLLLGSGGAYLYGCNLYAFGTQSARWVAR